MVKKKILAVAIATVMAVPAVAIPASAKDGDIIKVGGLDAKIVSDFDYLQDGLRIGQNGDKHFISKDNVDNSTYGFNFHVADKAGVDGSKGIMFSVTKNFTHAEGYLDGFRYDIEQSPNTANENLVGATDFLIWVDFSNDTLDDVPAINVNFDEWDYNDDGTPAMVDVDKVDPATGNTYTEKEHKITTRNLADDASNVYYVMADGTNTWVPSNTLFPKKGTTGWVAYLPKQFKGYVRCPLSCFDCTWQTDDKNGIMDLKHVTKIGVYFGLYPKHVAIDHPVVFDNIAFAGDWTNPTTTTNNNQPATTASNDNNTNTTVSNDSSNTSSNPSTGEAPITAALVTAVVFAGALVVSKKRDRK